MKNGTTFDQDKQERQDVEFLMSRGEFRRFLLRVIQSARIFQPATDGSDRRNLNEGRRDLGLEILSMVEAGQPFAHQHPAGPIVTVAMTLNEEISKPQGRTRNEQVAQSRADELADDDDSDVDQADRA